MKPLTVLRLVETPEKDCVIILDLLKEEQCPYWVIIQSFPCDTVKRCQISKLDKKIRACIWWRIAPNE